MARDPKKKNNSRPKKGDDASSRSGFGLPIVVAIAAFLIVIVASSFAQSDSDGGEDWLRLKQWVLRHGAHVHEGLVARETLHGGNKVRGVVTNVAIARNTVILRIPKKLWLTEYLERAGVVPLESVQECAEEDTGQIMLSACVALELQKGASAFHAPYLQMFPSMQDYSSFHPYLAEQRVLEDFAGLPLLHDLLEEWKEEMRSWEKCFSEWRSAILAKSEHPIGSLTFADLLIARIHVRTRMLHFNLVPVFDLINTASRKEINTQSREKNDMFEVVTIGEVVAGSEILYGYTDTDNEAILSVFGFYLEANSQALNSLGRVNCSSLEPHTMAELQIEDDSVKQALSEKWGAPRCRLSTGKSLDEPGRSQQVLRCSLARLAWETCAESWGRPGWKRSLEPPSDAAVKDHFRVHSNLGLVLVERGDLAGAADRFQEATRINPVSPEALFNLARMREQLKDYNGAMKSLRKAKALKPNDASIRRKLEALQKLQER